MDDMNMDKDKMEKLMTHINEHVAFPATKQDIMNACNKMEDVPDEEKKMLEKLPGDKTFNKPEEVQEALKMNEEE